jgi:hypothetical protein
MSFRLKVAVAFGLSFLLLAGVLLYVIGFLPSPKEPGKPADLKQAPPQVAVPAPDPVVEPAETIAIQAVEEKAPEPDALC